MRHSYKKLFLILFVLSLVACNKEPDITIGLLMDDFTTERWEKDREIFIRRANELNAKVFVKIAHGDQDKQILQAKQLIDTGVNILVVVPCDYEKSAPIVDIAHNANIKVMAYDRLIRNADLDFYISFDNTEVGRLQAEYITKVKPVGKYALIGGSTKDNNAYMIQLGQMEILQPLVMKGDIIIACNMLADKWTLEEGYKKTKECMDVHPDIDAIIAGNDVLATGALQAIDEYDLPQKILVAGQDADLNACKRILLGQQSMTVYKPIEKLAIPAAEMALRLTKNQPAPDFCSSIHNGYKWVPCMLLTPIAVNAETIKMTVVADGYQEEKNIYDTN